MSDVSGFNELERAIENMINQLDEGITQVLEETATECIAETQSRTPVKSGDLRRSWTHSEVKTNGTEKYIELGSAIQYAQPVEEGHRQGSGFVEGRHMLKDSITIAERELKGKINNVVSTALGR